MNARTQHLPVKALSIRQPWVWAILNAGKHIENRPRRFHYRGPICLHASLHKPSGDDFRAYFCVQEDFSDHRMGVPSWPPGHIFDRGGIVGTAEIVDCVDHSDDPWFFGPFGLVLENVQPVEFVPVKGALGLFDWQKRLTEKETI